MGHMIYFFLIITIYGGKHVLLQLYIFIQLHVPDAILVIGNTAELLFMYAWRKCVDSIYSIYYPWLLEG